MKKKIKKDSYKVRGFRIEDEIYDYLLSLKPRDKSWNLFFKEFIDVVKYFKNLQS